MGKLTISMAIFNSFLYVSQRLWEFKQQVIGALIGIVRDSTSQNGDLTNNFLDCWIENHHERIMDTLWWTNIAIENGDL